MCNKQSHVLILHLVMYHHFLLIFSWDFLIYIPTSVNVQNTSQFNKYFHFRVLEIRKYYEVIRLKNSKLRILVVVGLVKTQRDGAILFEQNGAFCDNFCCQQLKRQRLLEYHTIR